ncbi:MAG: CHAT domain-containing tetratricopeptide repeat protein, partial [Nakamurella sp.]
MSSLATTTDSLESAAREALQLVSADPARAWKLATRISADSAAAQQWSANSIAEHAIGLAAKQLGELKASSTALHLALRSGIRADSPVLVAEARASQAGTLLLQGRPARALVEVNLALGDLHGVAAAKVLTQKAVILQIVGRDDEALAAFRQALPTLRRAGEADWATRALSNRSLLYITRRSFGLAEADLLAAQHLCREHGLTTWAAYIEQNLGWLASNRGEMVAALEHYGRAEEQFRAIGAEKGTLLEARARLLLSVRLVEEARTAADAAIAVHREQRAHTQLVDAQLLLSTVALVQGDTTTAAAAAGQALRGFKRLDRPGGAVLARYAQLQASLAADPRSVTHHQARRCADQLASEGWLVPSLEARILAGRLALSGGRRSDARRDLALAGRARFTGPAEVRTRAWLAEADLRNADGRPASAKRAISAGLRIVEDYQATLGATELRAHVSIHRGALAAVGSRMALSEGNARRVLSFVERGRASALSLRPPIPSDDPVLSADLADLRTTMMEIENSRDLGRSATAQVHRQVRLERRIADRCRQFPGAAGGQPKRRKITELIGALGRVALVEYVELDDMLYAVTVVDGRARLRQLGSTTSIAKDITHLCFALRRLARDGSNDAARRVLFHLRESFDTLLFGPIRAYIGDRSLVLVPSAALQSLPWSVLPTCAGRPITISPSARIWLAATESRRSPGSGTVVIAGPDLSGAQAEAEKVASVYPDARLMVGSGARVSEVKSAMDGAGLVHIAAHGLLRSDNPFFSSLLLTDGPLTVYELERLTHAPHHVVLAACQAATPKVVAQDEVLGLATALLAQGTASLVAPVVTVLDQAIVALMVDYHRLLRAGSTPAEAIAAAQTGPDGQPTWAAAGFICIGDGH